jgi:hypothetical protein
VKGHIYYYPQSLDDQGIARNRLDDLVIVWCEVGLVENILACREPPMPLRTSDASMDAAQIHGGGESAVLLVKDQRHYNRYVDQATVEGLRVELRTDVSRTPQLTNWRGRTRKGCPSKGALTRRTSMFPVLP